MVGKIINRVAKSDLITIDFSDYFAKKTIAEIDLKDFLSEGLILKEQAFRSQLKETDFSVFNNTIVGVFCSVDTIVPMWAYMLLSSSLTPFAKVYFGNKKDVASKVLLKNIGQIDASNFEGKKVIVKGCGNIKINEEHYLAITKKLRPVVRSLMFGEACSSVPIFK